MGKSKLNEKLLQKLSFILIQRAKNNDVIEYGQLSKEIGNAILPHKLNEPLGEISFRCIKNDMPPLSAIVVNQNTQLPGEGFFTWVAAKMGFQNLLANEWEEFYHQQKAKVFIEKNWDNFLNTFTKSKPVVSSKKVWIFQGNPTRFDIDDYIQENDKISWSLNQERYKNDIEVGDTVFIWRADGGQKGSGGIIAKGIVTKKPIKQKDENKYWNDNGGFQEKYRVHIDLEEKLLNGPYIKRIRLLEHKLLKELMILKVANQTNFFVEPIFADELLKIWNDAVTKYIEVKRDIESELAQEDNFYKDGQAVTYYGTRYERNPHNRLKAIEIHGLACFGCEFDFEEVYGEKGKGFIEIHHIHPLSEIKEAMNINPETDLLPICSNCHRMIHRDRNKVLTIDELRDIIRDPKRL
jgi:predicted HNH restriction endonuclease